MKLRLVLDNALDGLPGEQRVRRPCFRGACRDYPAIWAGCESAGGLSTLADVMSRSSQGGLLGLLGAGLLLVVPLHHVLWLPNFQFDRDGGLLEGVRLSVLEMRCVMDSTEMTSWFCAPNQHLDLARPMQLVAARPEAVVSAAREAHWLELAATRRWSHARVPARTADSRGH